MIRVTRSRFVANCTLLALLCAVALQAQDARRGRPPVVALTVVADNLVLKIDGEIKRPLALSDADLSSLTRHTVRATDHGTPAVFEGYALGDVVRLAGVEFGEKLRGKNLELCLVAEAADGYRAVFALPEIDPAFTDRLILIADRRDGKPLSADEGRWRIVVPDERRHARWVRQVVRLSIRRVG